MDSPRSQLFYGQFLLTFDRMNVPLEWNLRTIKEWTLATDPGLPTIDLVTEDGSLVGWLLGYPISEKAELLSDAVQMPFDRPDVVQSGAFEDYLYTYGGRFACVLVTESIHRLYLDAGGTLACVYATNSRVAGSTNTLVLWNVRGQFPERETPLGALRSNQFYPAGLTADPDIRRLLPNHYLDLQEWRAIRHWLATPPERTSEKEIPVQVEAIAKQLNKNVEAVTKRYHTYMGLTAGRDTRMVLACCRPLVHNMTFYTFHHQDKPKNSAVQDLSVSRTLARRLRLSRKVVPIVPPAEDVKREYLARIGYAGNWGKAKTWYYACAQYLDRDNAILTGFGGEVGRTRYWLESDPGGRLPGATDLLAAMWLPKTDQSVAAMEEWLSGLPGLHGYDKNMLLTQIYLEQRLGCCESPHMYGAAAFAANLTPFCHRRIFDAMMRLPVGYRHSKQLAKDVIDLMWPKLNELPFQ